MRRRDVMKQTMFEDDDVFNNKSNSSGSCFDVKNSNGSADLNEPLQPVGRSEYVTYYPHGRRNNIDVEGQTQNRQIVFEAGNDQLHLLRPNYAFQPRRGPVTDHSKVKVFEERAYGKLKVCSKRPQVSYDSYLGSSSVAPNAPRLNNFIPRSLLSSPGENPMSSSQPYSVETNGLYQGFSSGCNPSVFNFPSTGFKPNYEGVKSQSFESLQGPRTHERSAVFPRLEPRRIDLSNGWIDTRDDLTSASAHWGLSSGQKGLFSAPYSNNANMGRVNMINSQSSTRVSNPFISHSLSIADQNKEVRHWVQRDHKHPFDASVSLNQHHAKAKEEGEKAAKFRHHIGLNSCANGLYQGSSFEMNSHVSNGLYQGFSSGSKQPVFSQSFQSLQGPRKQEGSDGFPWLKPQPPHRSELFNGSTNQFMDGTDTSASAQRGLWSSSYPNNVNMGRVNKINSQSNTDVSGCPIFQKEHTPFISRSLCIPDQHKEAGHLVKPDLNIPFDALVSSVNQHGAIAKKEGKKAANEVDQDSGLHSHLKLKIQTRALKDSEALPSLENKGENSQEKPNEKTRGLKQSHDERMREKHMEELYKTAAEAIVAISSSALSWFADIITSSNDESNRVESSSEGSDYFETVTLKIQPMTEEEYIPKPLLSEHLKFEETSTKQPRKRLGRKGKKEADFQKYILPVISTLSRREVREDFQTFELTKTGDRTLRSGMATRRNPKRKQMVELEGSKPTGRGQEAKRQAAMRQRRDPSGKFCKRT